MRNILKLSFILFLSIFFISCFWDNSRIIEHTDENDEVYATCKISWQNDYLFYQYKNKKQDFITAFKKNYYADDFVKGPTYIFIDKSGKEILFLYVSVKEMYLENGYVKTNGKIKCEKDIYDEIVDYR